jgi:hypothetical protein
MAKLRIDSKDVPQADSLCTVRRIVEEIKTRNRTVGGISKATNYSERHVLYRLRTAQILGLVTTDRQITAIASALLAAIPNTEEETKVWRSIIERCPVVIAVAPKLFANADFDLDKVTAHIQRISGLVENTANRRARVFRAWRKHILRSSPVAAL